MLSNNLEDYEALLF